MTIEGYITCLVITAPFMLGFIMVSFFLFGALIGRYPWEPLSRKGFKGCRWFIDSVSGEVRGCQKGVLGVALRSSAFSLNSSL